MADPRFYDNHGPIGVDSIQVLTEARLQRGSPDAAITDVAALDLAGLHHLAFCGSPKFVAALRQSKATAFLVRPSLQGAVPEGAICLISDEPGLAFARVAAALYPDAGLMWRRDEPPASPIDPTVRIGHGSVIAPGAFLGPGVEIGCGTTIGYGAVLGRGVRVGDHTRIGPNVSLTHSLVGSRVTIHSGSAIGQDGFGFIGGQQGHHKIPHLGRVLIEDDVEIGANTTIDRGALGDTVIGEGTKIDNLVQVGHNVRIGRHCRLAAQVGISGSATLGDFVVLAGQTGVGDHVTIGPGAIFAGRSGITKNLEGGRVYAGYPARPVAEWRREEATLRRLARRRTGPDEGES